MHFLEVISSVSRFRFPKCTKIVGGWRFAPNPTEEAYSAPQSPSWIEEGLLLRPLLMMGRKEELGRKDRGRKGTGEMIYAPGRQ